jgi:putative transposase
MQGPMRERLRKIIRRTCDEMGVHIVRGVLARDHVHMFLSIPPKLSLSDVMQRIKGRSSRRIQMEFPELRKRYWGRRFWARGYFSTRISWRSVVSSSAGKPSALGSTGLADILRPSLRRDRPRPNDKGHMDEVVAPINGVKHWLWRAVDWNAAGSCSNRAFQVHGPWLRPAYGNAPPEADDDVDGDP